MRTALEKLLGAIEDDKSGHRSLLTFAFRFGGYEIDYSGRYYGYVYEGSCANTETEDEYGWKGYGDMLDTIIRQTGRTMRQMLSELPEHDLEIEFDDPLPQNAVVTDIS